MKSPAFQKKLRHYSDRLIKSRKVIINSNLLLGYGTDHVAGYNNYECGREYSAWLRNGIDPFCALRAATANNAKILGLEDEIGTIKVGKIADIAAWSRDLLHDEDALLNCNFVMKNGEVY